MLSEYVAEQNVKVSRNVDNLTFTTPNTRAKKLGVTISIAKSHTQPRPAMLFFEQSNKKPYLKQVFSASTVPHYTSDFATKLLRFFSPRESCVAGVDGMPQIIAASRHHVRGSEKPALMRTIAEPV